MKVAFCEVILSENRRSMFLDGLSLVQDTVRACAMNIETNISEMDVDRLEQERASYQELLDLQIENAYLVASEAKSKRLDFSESVEIPRASDLASRTEKLLEDPYLYPDPDRRDKSPLRIEGNLRALLQEHDRETAAIMIAISVTNEMHSRTGDRRRSIDSGLRVGLAVLTEAVLVAPLDLSLIHI